MFRWHNIRKTRIKIETMQTSNLKQEKVFVVDDDQMVANLYARKLQKLGFEKVSIYDDGLECINALVQEPKIIFLDHNMQNLNGIEVLTKIKRFDPNIYVIMISGQNDMETAVNSLKFGAFDYLIKGEHDTQKIESVIDRIQEVEKMLSKESTGFLRKVAAIFS